MRQIAFLVARGITQSPDGGFDMRAVSPIVHRGEDRGASALTLYVVLELDPDDGGLDYQFSYTVTDRLTRDIDAALLKRATLIEGGMLVRAPEVPAEFAVSAWGLTFEVNERFDTSGPRRMILYASGIPVATTILQIETT